MHFADSVNATSSYLTSRPSRISTTLNDYKPSEYKSSLLNSSSSSSSSYSNNGTSSGYRSRYSGMSSTASSASATNSYSSSSYSRTSSTSNDTDNRSDFLTNRIKLNNPFDPNKSDLKCLTKKFILETWRKFFKASLDNLDMKGCIDRLKNLFNVIDLQQGVIKNEFIKNFL